MKICSKCKIEKDISCFSIDKQKKDGLYSSCKNCGKDINKQYRLINRDKTREYWKIYRIKNKDKILNRNRLYKNIKTKTDPVFRLRHIVSVTVGRELRKNQSNKKSKSILKFLPYTINELKIHLEKQFDQYMTWENHGTYWNVDHIYPQSRLPYTSMEDENFKKCWSLENLRPLEKIANLRKGNKI